MIILSALLTLWHEHLRLEEFNYIQYRENLHEIRTISLNVNNSIKTSHSNFSINHLEKTYEMNTITIRYGNSELAHLRVHEYY